jgi:undecaprenyl-diphosphatase
MFSWIQENDLRVMDWTYTHMRSRVGDIVMPILSISGNFGFIWFLITAILFVTRINTAAAYAIFWALFISALLANIFLKNIIRRPRPFTVKEGYNTLIDHPMDFSFPSGHTCSSFAAATTLCFFCPFYGIMAILLACGISASRLYLCVHFLSDVLFSIAFGVAVAFGVQTLINMNLL